MSVRVEGMDRSQHDKWLVLQWYSVLRDHAICRCIECGDAHFVRRCNILSGASKGCTSCKVAAKYQTPLTKEAVCAIRHIGRRKGSRAAIAKTLGVSPNTVTRIKAGARKDVKCCRESA